MTGHSASDKAERISVRDANQGFSRVIARVEQGARFIITKNNVEVARIEPMNVESDAREARRNAARERLKQLMNAGWRSEDGWTFHGRREELHDRSV